MMEEMGFPIESETTFSETEIEAAEQLVQLSEEDTMSCSSGTNWTVSDGRGCEGRERCNAKRQEDVVSSKVRDTVGKEPNDSLWRNENVSDGRRFVKAITETKRRRNKKKKKKFRSLASIYRATKEMKRDIYN